MKQFEYEIVFMIFTLWIDNIVSIFTFKHKFTNAKTTINILSYQFKIKFIFNKRQHFTRCCCFIWITAQPIRNITEPRHAPVFVII